MYTALVSPYLLHQELPQTIASVAHWPVLILDRHGNNLDSVLNSGFDIEKWCDVTKQIPNLVLEIKRPLILV